MQTTTTKSAILKFCKKLLVFRRTKGWPPSAAWPLQDAFPMPTMNPQLQSPLFGKLSAELRILIYQYALGDPERYMHICFNMRQTEFDKRVRPVAHFRCIDMDSPFPTWQHACFGQTLKDTPHYFPVQRVITETDDKLLALLLTCRLIYSEGLEVLYKDNIFHFRGGLSLPAFRDSIPKPQWTAIRHIHISTTYMQFYRNLLPCYGGVIAESLPNWPSICEYLKELPSLQTLGFDILAKDHGLGPVFDSSKTRILLSILTPLKAIRACSIAVELNVEVPDQVWEALGPVDFKVTTKERQFNETVFRNNNHLFDAMEAPLLI